jgi:hypothetical protein
MHRGTTPVREGHDARKLGRRPHFTRYFADSSHQSPGGRISEVYATASRERSGRRGGAETAASPLKQPRRPRDEMVVLTAASTNLRHSHTASDTPARLVLRNGSRSPADVGQPRRADCRNRSTARAGSRIATSVASSGSGSPAGSGGGFRSPGDSCCEGELGIEPCSVGRWRGDGCRSRGCCLRSQHQPCELRGQRDRPCPRRVLAHGAGVRADERDRA